jgi:hypothetical protein
MRDLMVFSSFRQIWLLAFFYLASLAAPVRAQQFGPPTIFPLPAGSTPAASVALVDLDHDGNLDAVVLNECQEFVCVGGFSVFLGTGDGKFQSPAHYDSAQFFPRTFAVADFDGDGNADVFIPGLNGKVEVSFGNGDGTFRMPVVSTLTLGGPFAVAAGDFNGDGRADLALTVEGGIPGPPFNVDYLVVLLSNGDGTFQTPLTFSVGHYPYGVTAADFDQDGRLDLAFLQSAYGNVTVLLGNGDGTFRGTGNFHTGRTQFGNVMAAADVNGDGNLDLIVPTEQILRIAFGNGDGTFQQPLGLHTGFEVGPKQVVAGDFNGNGRIDLALALSGSDQLAVYIQKKDRSFRTEFYSGLSGPIAVAIGDLNHDGFPDLVVADANSQDIAVFLNTGKVSKYEPVENRNDGGFDIQD